MTHKTPQAPSPVANNTNLQAAAISATGTTSNNIFTNSAGWWTGTINPAGLVGKAPAYRTYAQTHIININDPSGQSIVTLNLDGTVTWANEINIDEAAKAFANVLSLSAEIKTGITNGVKAGMRDIVFEEIISISKEKGSLTTAELTLMFEACKIMEKLKGGNGL